MQEQMLKLILEKVEYLVEKVDKLEVKVDKLEEGQTMIIKFIENSESTFNECEQDHEFIQKLKKAVCE